MNYDLCCCFELKYHVGVRIYKGIRIIKRSECPFLKTTPSCHVPQTPHAPTPITPTPTPSRHHPHTPPITLHPSHPPITPHPSCTPTPIYLFAALPTNPTLIPLGADFKTEFLNASLDRPYGPPPLRLKDKRQKSKKSVGQRKRIFNLVFLYCCCCCC